MFRKKLIAASLAGFALVASPGGAIAEEAPAPMSAEELEAYQTATTGFIRRMNGRFRNTEELTDAITVATNFSRETYGNMSVYASTLSIYEQLRVAGSPHDIALMTAIAGANPASYRPAAEPAAPAPGD